MKIRFDNQRKIGCAAIGLCFPIYTSIQRIMPTVASGFVLMALSLFCLALAARSNSRYYSKLDFFNLILIFAILAMLLLNNNHIKSGNFDYTIYFVLMEISCLILARLRGWVKYIFNFFIGISIVHIAANWIFYFIPKIYYIFAVRFFPQYALELIFNYTNKNLCGLTVHYTQNAMYLSVAFGIFFCCMLGKDYMMKGNKNRIFMFLSIAVVILFLIMAKRGTFIFSLISALIVYFLSRTENFSKTLITIILSGILIVVGYYILKEYLPDIANIFTRIADSSKDSKAILNGREEYFDHAIKIWHSSPIIGVGLGGTYLIHNCYLQILAEYGLVGFMIYTLFFVYNLVRTIMIIAKTKGSEFYKKYNSYINFSLFFQLFFILFCTTENPLYEVIMICPYFISVAISMWYQNNCQYI